MKNILALIIGLILIPVIMICLYIGINHLLEFVSNSQFNSINKSSIWVPEILIILVIIVTWFITNPLNADWEE